MELAPDCLRPIIALAVCTGMRRSEILKLRWLDIELTWMAARYQHLSPSFLAEAVGRLDAAYRCLVLVAGSPTTVPAN